MVRGGIRCSDRIKEKEKAILKRTLRKKIAVLVSMVLLILSVAVVPMTEIRAEAAGYTYSETATSGSVTLKVEWNEPVLGQATTFHVSATG